MECRLLLVQPSRLSREGLGRILQRAAGTLQDVASVQAFLTSESLVRPDAVVWGQGIDIKALSAGIAAVRARFAREPVPVKHIVIADELGAKFMSQMLMLDVEALLHADITGQVLLLSIELVMLGQRLFPVSRGRKQPMMQAEVVPFPGPHSLAEDTLSLNQTRETPLSLRERDVLRQLVDGASNKAIALDLQITEEIVKVHVRALLRKIRAANRTQAATWALRHGYRAESEHVDPSRQRMSAARG